MKVLANIILTASMVALSFAAGQAGAAAYSFSTGDPDGLMATASRPDGTTHGPEVETADDFILATDTTITGASFTGLVNGHTAASNVNSLSVEIYRVFPLDSTVPASGNVPTRANSPSDVAFDTRDSSGGLTFSTLQLNPSFTATNSVINGIHPLPGQMTGGEGPVTALEMRFNVNFTTPLMLPAGHYFFVPQVNFSVGDFLWLSAPRPITGGTGPFVPDLQTWIRNASLSPDWLRVGTDIVGQGGAFNASFSLSGVTAPVPEPSSYVLLLAGLGILAFAARSRRLRSAAIVRADSRRTNFQ
jgi:hypothetical protein